MKDGNHAKNHKDKGQYVTSFNVVLNDDCRSTDKRRVICRNGRIRNTINQTNEQPINWLLFLSDKFGRPKN